jgi:hypothetical protein
MAEPGISNETQLELIKQEMGHIRSLVFEIKTKIDSNNFVTKEEFNGVKNVVYGGIGLILSGVILAGLGLILR